MTEELVKVERPLLPERWDYEESVEKVKGFIYKWKNLTIEIAQELFIAREKLRSQGQRSDLTSGKNTRSWTIYCKDIGSSRRVVNNWLNRFFPPELPEAPEITGPYDEIADIREGKFEELEKDIPDDSIDAIITDPPYRGQSSLVWGNLSRIGSRILKPSGYLITYSGHFYLPFVFYELWNSKLEWFHQFILLHTGAAGVIRPTKINVRYKPILVFYKPPLKSPDNYFDDVIIGSGRDKSAHEWQQSEGEMEKIMEIFTKQGDLVLDPYAGSGTTLVVAKKMKRNFIGIDSDPECIKIIRSRLYKAGGVTNPSAEKRRK